MINYGIDLGTTNSSIAKFVKGEVEVFNNPMETSRNSLPSVVYYKKDYIFRSIPTHFRIETFQFQTES